MTAQDTSTVSAPADPLAVFVAAYRGMRLVDLSATLENGAPKWPTHPPLIIHPTVTHAADGYFTNTLFMPEHIGTHCDAPAHIHPGMAADTIETYPLDQMIGPACVIDLRHLDLGPGERVGLDAITAWEAANGPVGEGEIALLNFGWYAKHWALGAAGRHYVLNAPGLDEAAVRYLHERGAKALGSDCTACEQPVKNGVPAKSYAHDTYFLPNRRPLLESLANLEQLPPRCFLLTLPLKIKGGSGSPIRPMALVPAG